MTYRTEVHHRLPALRQSPVQHAANDLRAYRLGRCEMLEDIGRRLANRDCTFAALRRQIKEQLARLTTAPADAADTPSEKQTRRGQADACRACLAFIANDESSRATLAVHIACLLIAAWPPDYRRYRHRCKAYSVEDPALPERVDCLKLPDWYDAVDALHAEIDRSQRAGLPPSAEQKTLEILLLRMPGEAAPCAE